MMAREVRHPDFRAEPYWWEAAPPEEARDAPLPERVDLLVVGSGFCGLSAALDAGRAGASVAVLDGGALGGGASATRPTAVRHPIAVEWLPGWFIRRFIVPKSRWSWSVQDRLWLPGANACFRSGNLANCVIVDGAP